MPHLIFGQVQARAREAGLVMHRDRTSGAINLRHRVPREGQQAWRNLTIHEAAEVIRSGG